jgi:polysaccharide deacetylase family protein (PEP-CTERM system associated)
MSLIRNAFTIDVEDYFQVAALAGSVNKESWTTRESRVERNTRLILAMLAEHDVRGTFFILGWIAERHPGLVREVFASGHEVASHGYSHDLIYNQSEAKFREETVRSKSLLEDITGSAIKGYRAASFSITARSLWALDVLLDLDFEYDSSVFPIQHDRYGIPGASRSIGMLTAPSGRKLLEFPMSVARICGVSVPVSGGGYFRLLPYQVTRHGLQQINEKEQRPFTFYLHPWEVDPDQPRIAAPLMSRFRHYTNLSACEARLRRLLKEFSFGTMKDALFSYGVK